MSIQIYFTLTTYCIMATVQKKLGISRPIYEMLQLVSVSLTQKTLPDKLFGIPNYNIVNELMVQASQRRFKDCIF